MSYSAPRLPRLIFGLIGGSMLALFALVLVVVFAPKLYEAYQIHRIQNCEDEHRITVADKQGVFGFDVGGWTVVGDSDRKRAFIKCVQNRLDARTGSNRTSQHPALEVVEYSFSYGLGLTYFPAASSPDRDAAEE